MEQQYLNPDQIAVWHKIDETDDAGPNTKSKIIGPLNQEAMDKFPPIPVFPLSEELAKKTGKQYVAGDGHHRLEAAERYELAIKANIFQPEEGYYRKSPGGVLPENVDPYRLTLYQAIISCLRNYLDQQS